MSSSNQKSQNSGCFQTYLTNHTPQREELSQACMGGKVSSSQKLDFPHYVENQVGTIPVTANPERKCREEAFYGTEVLDWRDLTKSWENYVEDKEGLEHILVNQDNGDRIYIDNSHSFERDYVRKQMGKFYSIENKALEEYGEDGLTTVMLTLTASPFGSDDELLPPIDHLDSLLDRDLGSWYAVKTAISRVLSDYDYEYMRILEPHTPDKGILASAGYAHLHIGLMVDDPNNTLHQEDFKSVMGAHINNCRTAGLEAHTVDKSVSVNPYDPDEKGGVGAYLTSYLGKTVNQEPLDAENYLKRFYSLLWGSNRRQVGFSNGANKWAKEDYEDGDEEEDNSSGDWNYWGIREEDEYGDMEETEVEGGNSGSYLDSLNSICESNNLQKPKSWQTVKTTNIWEKPYPPPD